MNNKTLGYVVAVVGIIAAIGGFALWGHDGFSSKKLDGALVVGVVLLVVGAYMAFAPSRQAS